MKYKIGDKVKLLGLFPDGSKTVEVVEYYRTEEYDPFGTKDAHLTQPLFIGRDVDDIHSPTYPVYAHDIKYSPARHILYFGK